MYESYLQKTTVRKSGRYIAYILSLLCITNIIIISIQFKYINITWISKGIWRHYSILSILACMFQVLGISLALIINFRHLECKTLQKIFCIYQLIAIIFVLFVCNFSLICATIKENNETKNCIKDLKGFFSQFLILDKYFQNIDSILCSNECPCVISNRNVYDTLNNEEINKISFNEEISDNDIIRFQQCNYSIQDNINKEFTGNSKVKDKLKEIKIDKFYKYWKNIEEKFECVGWCNLNYDNSDNKNRIMKKYLFSDINKGIVNDSCMKKVTKYISKMIKIFGVLLYISWFLMVASYIFGFILCFDLVYEGPNVRAKIKNENSFEKGEIKQDSAPEGIKGFKINDNIHSNGNNIYVNNKENDTVKDITSSSIKDNNNESNKKKDL